MLATSEFASVFFGGWPLYICHVPETTLPVKSRNCITAVAMLSADSGSIGLRVRIRTQGRQCEVDEADQAGLPSDLFDRHHVSAHSRLAKCVALALSLLLRTNSLSLGLRTAYALKLGAQTNGRGSEKGSGAGVWQGNSLAQAPHPVQLHTFTPRVCLL